ncbi:MAG: SDR family oxidoreductase [Bacteroidia bacterium]|nr:SDR family oxidoreductase [Bacteroidia bacterium]
MKKVILVTGGSSGIGKSICEYLHTRDYKVYGTSRNPDRYSDFDFNLIALDVTDEQSVERCIAEVMDQAGRIDVLINNAGAGITGPFEEVPNSEIRKNLETNFIGPVSMMKAVLPIMRNQNSGKIINITSIAAYMGLPFRGIYSSGKAALEVLTEAIRMEVKAFNIEVTNLAPGDFATNIAAGRFHSEVDPNSAYGETYGRILNEINEHVDSGRDPLEVAKAVEKIIRMRHIKPHYTVGAFVQKFSVVLKSILPQKTFEKLLLRHHKL